jgi:hypothetical protein
VAPLYEVPAPVLVIANVAPTPLPLLDFCCTVTGPNALVVTVPVIVVNVVVLFSPPLTGTLPNVG